jgi:PcRGLX-like protein central beta sandwich domain/PcRGLX-like N-terminal RIFT barrel domain
MRKNMMRNVSLIVCLLAMPFSHGAFAAFKMPKVDPRAVESGLYIQPRKEVSKAKVEFTVTEPSNVDRKAWPVRGSVPIFRGELKSAETIRLLDAAGKVIPVQSQATAVWPEKTVKFLCLDFVVDLKAGETKKFVLEYGTDVAPAKVSGLKCTTEENKVAVDTGMMKVTFELGEAFCSQVTVNGKAVTRGPVTARALVSEGEPTADPKAYGLIIDEVKVVEQGTVQATVHLSGSYGKVKSASPRKDQKDIARYPFHAFVRVYAGSARMDITHNFGYNGDENSDYVRAYGLTVPMADAKTFVYGGDKGARQEAALKGDLALTQPGHSSWTLEGAAKASGKRFGGWAAVTGGNSAVFGLRSAWQNWPVKFTANAAGDLTLDIYGGNADTFLDLRYKPLGELEWKKVKWARETTLHISKSMYTGDRLSNFYGEALGRAMGITKISELVLDFTPNADPASIGNGQHQMLVPWAGAKRFSETRVLGLTGYYHDKDERHARAKDYFDIILDYPFAAHEVEGLYGWVDWPDAPDFEKPVDGKFKTNKFRGGQGWSNGERLMPAYLWHYMASGTRRAMDMGMQMAIHNMGFDIEHEGGEWPTGKPHRHNQVHWGDEGGPRQAGWRGWYAAWWLFGHNEIMRGIQEAHPMPMGIAKNSNVARWPWHTSRPKQKGWYIQPGDTQVFVHGSQGTPFTYMNLMRWMTTGEDEFVRFTDRIAQAYTKNMYVQKGKKKKNADGYLFSLADGSFIPRERQKPEPFDFENVVKPNFFHYYFTSYGGVTILSEWAQLTGSTAAIDCLLYTGDFFTNDNRGKKRIDIINSGNRGGGNPWQKYYAQEGMMPAYWLLRHKDQPERTKRVIKAMEWRMHKWSYGSPKKMKDGSKPAADPYSYTAESWKKMNVQCYGKNGAKIHMAHAMPVLYTLWFSLPK